MPSRRAVVGERAVTENRDDQKRQQMRAAIAPSGRRASLTRKTRGASATAGKHRSQTATSRVAEGLKVRTNVSRYRANGTTQSSGTAATSVDRKAVTASIRLDGTNARAIQRARRLHVTMASLLASAAVAPLLATIVRRHITTRTERSVRPLPQPVLQIRVWADRVNEGSMSVG